MLIRKRFKYLVEAGEAPVEAEGTTEVTDSVEGEQTPELDKVTNEAEGNKEPDANVDDNYDPFEMPEGMEVDQGLVDIFAPVMKDMNLTQEQAQLLSSTLAKSMQEQQQLTINTYHQQSEDWVNQAKNDKEYGGDNYEQSISHALGAIETFGTPELKEMLDQHGVGNHPELIRFMVKVGKATAEDRPGGSGDAYKAKGDHASILYPKD